jgi:hypothetical protein
MFRRFSGVSALVWIACVAPFGFSQTPEMPRSLLITVQPITYLPVDFVPVPQAPRLSDADRLEKNRPVPAKPSLLDVLDQLTEVESAAPARNAADSVRQLTQQIGLVRKLLQGSEWELHVHLDLKARTFELSVGVKKPLTQWAGMPYFQKLQPYALKVHDFVQKMHTSQGKQVMAEGLLKAAHLAMTEGRTNKAVELVRQAHALMPKRVEADPMVYKLHLLDTTKPSITGEEAAEPSRVLPIHPRQYPEIQKLRVWTNQMMESKHVHTARMFMRESFKASAIPTLIPANEYENGMLTLGLSYTGQPTATLFLRGPKLGAHWMVHVGNGKLPVVWMVPVR